MKRKEKESEGTSKVNLKMPSRKVNLIPMVKGFDIEFDEGERIDLVGEVYLNDT